MAMTQRSAAPLGKPGGQLQALSSDAMRCRADAIARGQPLAMLPSIFSRSYCGRCPSDSSTYSFELSCCPYSTAQHRLTRFLEQGWAFPSDERKASPTAQALRSGTSRRMTKSSVAKAMTQISAQSRLCSALLCLRCSSFGLRIILDPDQCTLHCTRLPRDKGVCTDWMKAASRAHGASAKLGELLACCTRRRRSPAHP